MCRLCTITLGILMLCMFANAADTQAPTLPETVLLNVNADAVKGDLYNFWNVFPVTIQSPFKDGAKHAGLREIYPYAKYINCVRFLGDITLEKDDYFRGVDADGEALCDFAEAIALLDGIRACGYTPWIVLDNVPARLSANPTKNKYGNTEPPADFKVWGSYVRQLVAALVAEYGAEEVGTWRFRVGTEPDLHPGHWSGTKEQYLAHYDHTVEAVLAVLPAAIIGPGNIIDPVKNKERGAWGLDIIDHCAIGTNYATGEIGTAMHFFASSYYTAVGDSDARFDQVIAAMRERLARYPQFSNLPVEVQEFGILTEGGKLIAGDGTEFGGAWMAHMAWKIYTLGVPRVYQWEWNTTKANGLPIPVTHVLGMLESMVGGQHLSVTASGTSEEDDIGGIACRKDDALHLLVYRHRAVRDNGDPIDARVVLDGSMGERAWRIVSGSIIDGMHPGFAHEHRADMDAARDAMGEDADPFAVAIRVMFEHREKYERMSALSPLDPLPAMTGGEIALRLDGHSVVYLRLE